MVRQKGQLLPVHSESEPLLAKLLHRNTNKEWGLRNVLGRTRNQIEMNALDWMFEQLWNTPKDKFEWNAILNKAHDMQNEHNRVASIGDFCDKQKTGQDN